MQIEFLGHSCFHFRDSQGTQVLVDPYDAIVGYQVPLRSADYTLITHSHFDHANLSAVRGATRIISSSGRHSTGDLDVCAVLAYHDNVQGATHGLVHLMAFTMDGLRICHLSDLGHLLEPGQLAQLGKVDVVCIPVGGDPYTIDAATAWQVVEQLSPRVIIPMHFRTALTNRHEFPIAGIEPFVEGRKHVVYERSGTLRLTPRELPVLPTVYVLTHTH
jgi:L-ascorbate metabolism protein UlaG (beta-lactamase superfamily)